MKYVALLRGINVGGNNSIKMTDLIRVFEKMGFSHVSSLIQSGNIIFESRDKDKALLTENIERELSKEFAYTSKIVIRSQKELTTILHNVPESWNRDKDLRCYIAFVKDPVPAEDVAKEIEVNSGIDELSVHKGVLYMSTKMDGLTKSKFVKFIGKKAYKNVTMRNFKTSRMILERMNS